MKMRGRDVPVRVVVVIAIVVAWSVLAILGGRDAAGVISGTPSAALGAAGWIVGPLYALSWLGLVLVAPPMVIGLALERLARRALARRAHPITR